MASRPPNRNSLDAYSSLSLMQDDEEDDGQLTPLYHPNPNIQTESSGSFFSRVKQTISSSPLGNILGQNNQSSARPNDSYAKNSNSSLNASNELGLQLSQDGSPAPTPRRLSTIKHVFTPMPGQAPSHHRSQTASSTRSDTSSDSSSPSACASSVSPACFSPMSLSSQPTLATSAHDSDFDDKWSPVLTSPSVAQDTPPLTPDMLSDPSGNASHNAYKQRSQRLASISIKEDESSSKGSDAKKGKNPAPPFPYDTLIADITNPAVPATAEPEELSGEDDSGEWWGLEYTLELSRRDSRASDTSTSTTGEHSKSRESWAAIHQGTIPPLYADANFQDWQCWHQALEKIELRRRRKRTIDFLEESNHLANLYLDECHAQRAIHMFEEVLTEEELYDALVWIEYAAERRPDPYFPPEKHNLAWAIKNHRSFASLRELKELPEDE